MSRSCRYHGYGLFTAVTCGCVYRRCHLNRKLQAVNRRENVILFILGCSLTTFSIYLGILSVFVTSFALLYWGLVDCARAPACCCHKTPVWNRFTAVQPQWRGDPGSYCCYKAPCPILELSLPICMLWMLVDALLWYTRSVWLHWYVIKC